MDLIERVSHPSSAQVEALVQFLEEKPGLAKGFLRNASAKAKALKDWDIISVKLNSIGGGAIKPAKKWIKYWSDKKSAVKKKASARATAMRRTGGGTEETPELSEIEERIVALMGGGGFATGDVHLRMQVFDEPTPDLSDSPSIMVGHSEQHLFLQPGPSTSAACTASPFQIHVENADLDILPIETGNVDSSHFNQRTRNQPPLEPVIVVQTPQRESPPEPRRPIIMEETVGVQTNRSAPSTPRRRRLRAVRRSPPSQRRSQFISIADKFLHIEQERSALQHRVVSVMEQVASMMQQNIEVNRLTAQASIALGEGLKALSDAIKKD